MKKVKKFNNYNLLVIRTFIFCLIILLSIGVGYSQTDYFNGSLSASGGYTPQNKMPFWLRANKAESIPSDGFSFSLDGKINKDYDKSINTIFDWGAGAEARAVIGRANSFNLIEGYIKLKVGIIELKTGRYREIMGLCDTSLTSGSFSVSGNAPGIPKIQVGIQEYYTLPILGRLIAFKGSYAHGWLGKIPMRLVDSVFPVRTYFHQKSFYGRFGKPEWRWKLYGGFNHQVFWGNESNYYGDIFTLTKFQTYLYVITGTPYGNSEIAKSKVGNHLGSIDVGLEWRIRDVKLLIYRQNVYDIGALYYLANIRDGLNGISIENIADARSGFRPQISGFRWNKLLFEVLYTKNQAGELWSPVTPSGDEDYYNNYQYYEGWSYKGLGIGSPFIGTREYIRAELPNAPRDHFINNRVLAFYLGFEASLNACHFVVKTSYSLNYGTYGTSVEGHSLGTNRTPPGYGIFPETRQFSAFFEANKDLKRNINFGMVGALDYGDLYLNSFGIILKIEKHF